MSDLIDTYKTNIQTVSDLSKIAKKQLRKRLRYYDQKST